MELGVEFYGDLAILKGNDCYHRVGFAAMDVGDTSLAIIDHVVTVVTKEGLILNSSVKNTCYVGVVPGYFAKKGRSSSVSGILNAFVNLGIATSMFATGAFSEAFGWDMTMIFWICCGGVGIFSSFIGYQIWKNYKLKLEA